MGLKDPIAAGETILRKLVVTDDTRRIVLDPGVPDSAANPAKILFQLRDVGTDIDVAQLVLSDDVFSPSMSFQSVIGSAAWGSKIVDINISESLPKLDMTVTDGTTANNVRMEKDGTNFQQATHALDPSSGLRETWHAVSYQNSWADFGGNYAGVAYKLMSDGTVRLRGTMKPGTRTDFTVVFNIPAAYRPVKYKQWRPRHDATSANGFVELQSNGDMIIVTMAGVNAITFDGITYDGPNAD